MIPANGAPHDLEARDVLRSLSFAQRSTRRPLCKRQALFDPNRADINERTKGDADATAVVYFSG
jgi:hypothetical protein